MALLMSVDVAFGESFKRRFVREVMFTEKSGESAEGALGSV